MKKNNNKKGFTIVELVIVIAVIAILAAVLIPTFANVIEKANQSAAYQEAKNEYTELLASDVDYVTSAGNYLIVVSNNSTEAYYVVVTNGQIAATATKITSGDNSFKNGYGNVDLTANITGQNANVAIYAAQ